MIKNYTYHTMYAGVTFHTTLPISEEDVWLGDAVKHYKLLCVMRSVYDSSVYHELCAQIDRDKNSIVISSPIQSTSQIHPGKYIFDVISRNSLGDTINKIIEGVIYVHPSYGLEAYEKAQKQTL